MQALSASIVVLAGALCLCAGAFVSESTPRTFIVMGTGGFLLIAGLFYWVISLGPPEGIEEEPAKEEDAPKS